MCIYEPLHGEMPTEAICKNGCEECPFNVPDIPKPENELKEEQEAIDFAREFMSDAVHETAKQFKRQEGR